MGLLDFLADEYSQAKNSFGLLGEVLKGAKRNPDNLKTVEAIKGLLGAMPGVGDVIAADDAINYAKQGQYGMSALASVGALPFIPGFAGHISDIKPPKWNSRISIPVGVNPTYSEIKELYRDAQAKSAGNALRVIQDSSTGDMYAWPADAALHQDIGAYFKINPKNATHGLITPD